MVLSRGVVKLSSSEIIHGDCLEVLPGFPDNHFDSIITDPPYGLEFMGKEWDSFKPAKGKWGDREHVPTIEIANDTPQHRSAVKQPAFLSRCQNCGGNSSGQWNRCSCGQPRFRKPAWVMEAYQEWCQQWASECLRVLKPGGHLLAFGGTRTYHRLACAIEDAGFEIRDSIHWIYGSGFPKSMDVSKAIDKAAGTEREIIGVSPFASRKPRGTWTGEVYGDEPEHRQGPSITASATDDAVRWEGWGTALKPAHEPIVLARKPLTGTVAANVLEYGTGGLNVNGCRVEGIPPSVPQPSFNSPTGTIYGMKTGEGRNGEMSQSTQGRFPPNILFAHSPDCAPGCPVAELDRQSRNSRSTSSLGDTGGASRFFPQFTWSPEYDFPFTYCTKAPASERPRAGGITHPTCKPVALMRWLVRLVTPPGGIVLDPFAGTGTTGEACLEEGFRYILIEREEDYIKLIHQRFSRREPSLFEEA